MPEQTSVEWLRMMRDHSGLTDCKPRFAEIAMEIDRLRTALMAIGDAHIPDQPAAAAGDDLTWAQRHVGLLRRIALDALKL